MSRKLHVVIGPTAVGKSGYALALAEKLHVPILSADSRQIFKRMPIGTATPTPEEQKRVQHYFIQTKEPTEAYSAVDYAEEATNLVQQLFSTYEHLVMVGGSMLYLKHFLEGYDPIPQPDPSVRQALWDRFETEGVAPLRAELLKVDPDYLQRIDTNNHKRIIRALEVYHTTGQPFTSFHEHQSPKQHPYAIDLVYLTMPRAQLYRRIEQRVGEMFRQGLVEEVESLRPYRACEALNTIGYKELFAYFDGQCTLEEAKRQIIKNTKTFARQQMRFFEKHWIHPEGSFPYTVYTLTNT